MVLLLASLVALAAGPALAARLAPDGPGMAGLDGFVLVAVAGLVFLHLLPDAVLTGGWWAVGAASVGLVLPGLGERVLFHVPGPPHASARGTAPREHHGQQAHGSGRALLVLALTGLALHAALDGAALLAHDLHAGAPTGVHAAHEESPIPTLALGVILHRLPLGLAVWWAAGQGPHRRRAVGLLALLGAATIAGFFIGQEGLAHLPLRGLAVFQALVAGALVHVVFQHPPAAAAAGRAPILAAAAGGLLGAATLVGLAWLHSGHGHGASHNQDPALLFVAMLLRAAPALLAGLALSAAVRGAVRPRAALAVRPADGPRGRGVGAGLAAALRGLLLPARVPACPCHTRAHFRDLLGRGEPVATALAYLLASPALGLVPFTLAWALFGPALALSWALAAVGVVLLAALAGALAARQVPAERLATALHEHPLPARPLARALASVRPLVGHSLAWGLAGIALGAYLAPLVGGVGDGDASPSLAVAAGASWGHVLAAALLAVPVYMGGAGAAALAGALLAAGVGPGPVLAALVVVTALHPASLPLVASTLGARAAAAVGVTLVAGAAGAALIVQALDLPLELGWAAGVRAAPEAIALAPSLASAPLTWVALVGVGGLLLASLLRLGPRGLLAEMFPLSPARSAR